MKQTRFIDEKSESEARIAREQLRQMVHYAETRECRRRTLLHYFAEERPNEPCDDRANCLNPPETVGGTVAAQKVRSCGAGGQQQSGGNQSDPLGRPLHGREFGDDLTVKIPGEIDVQRVRRILEELRRRLADPQRPQIELGDIERLLKDY